MPLVKPRTTVDCTGLPVYDFSKSFNKEEIGKGAYGAVLTADYPFNAIDDKGQEFRVLGASFSRCFVFEIWVLRASVFVFECFVFETTINFIHVDRSLACTQTVNGLDPIQHQLKPLYNAE